MSAHRAAHDLMDAPFQTVDPGTGNPIVVTRNWEYISFVTGAAGETNTLPDPTGVGRVLILHLLTHGGGDRVVTASTVINQSNNTIMTFGADDDYIELRSVDDGAGGYRWQVISNDGAALS